MKHIYEGIARERDNLNLSNYYIFELQAHYKNQYCLLKNLNHTHDNLVTNTSPYLSPVIT